MADIDSINHTAVCVHDLPQAVRFYCDVLGATPHQRTNFSTEDALRGVAVFESVIVEDYLIALGVAPGFMPMPDDGKLRGAHGFRHGFVVTHAKFGDVMERLKSYGVAFEGPNEHPANGPFGESIYFKDPSGNFLEVLWRRDEEPNPKKRRYINVE
jgi:extradiol dioxygenase family protein